MVASNVQTWIQQQLVQLKYSYVQPCFSELVAVMDEFPSLKLKTEYYIPELNVRQLLFVLYTPDLEFWLPLQYPNDLPFVRGRNVLPHPYRTLIQCVSIYMSPNSQLPLPPKAQPPLPPKPAKPQSKPQLPPKPVKPTAPAPPPKPADANAEEPSVLTTEAVQIWSAKLSTENLETLQKLQTDQSQLNIETTGQFNLLHQRRNEYEHNTAILQQRIDQCNELIKAANSTQHPTTAAEIVKQSINKNEELDAEFHAINDTIELLSRGLDTGAIEVHMFLRLVRELGRRQFHCINASERPLRPPKM